MPQSRRRLGHFRTGQRVKLPNLEMLCPASTRVQIPAPPPFQLQFEAPILFLALARTADGAGVQRQILA